MPDRVEGNTVKFAGTTITVDGELVAKITKFGDSTSISEEDVTGSEDYIPGTNVLRNQFTPISVDETVDIEGIAIETNDDGPDIGQSDLKDAAKTGQQVVIRHVKHTGYGSSFTGFFTSYEEEGDKGQTYKFKGSFRANQVSEITPGS
jgi:hypothetical protein